MNELYSKIAKNLENNNIKFVFAPKKDDVKGIVENLLFEGALVTNGGSVSLAETGIMDLLKSGKYNYLDRSHEGITAEEKDKIYRDAFNCDFYFCSTNALTENGELVNVDGTANRISAIAFGPKKVIMVVGKNKIVKDAESGLIRVKKTAAPKNCERLCIDNPCRKLGFCVSLLNNDNPSFTDGCNLKTRICRNYLVSSKQYIKDRITVILVDEELGF